MITVALKVPIISGSAGDKAHVDAIIEALKGFGIDFQCDIASAHKQHERVVDLVDGLDGYNNGEDKCNSPVVTAAGRSDALSASVAFMSYNPVVSSRPDWKSPEDLMDNLFSTINTPSRVVSGAVLGPQQTAGYVHRLLGLREKRPADDTVPLICLRDEYSADCKTALGKANEYRLLKQVRRASLDEIGDTPLCILFGYGNDEQSIDRVLRSTQRPLILCPPASDKRRRRETMFESAQRGYFPEVAVVLDPANAGLYAATIIGMYNRSYRDTSFMCRHPLL